MKILHLLTSGGIGGIEVLCKDIASYSSCENYFCFLFGEGKIFEQMQESNKNVFSFNDGKKLSYSKLNKLKELARTCDVVVVHHDDPFLETYYLALKRSFPAKKFFSMVHHCYDPRESYSNYGIVKKTIKHFIIAKMFRKSDNIIFVSDAGRKSYENSFHMDQNKLCVIYNGIGDEFLESGKNVVKEKGNTIRLLYVGRLVELKGVTDLIEIIPKLISKYKIHLDIVGDGKCRNDLEQKVLEFGINDFVEFYGFQDDVTSYLSTGDIFIYPSKTEIFGISIVEAMAYKCICVANNVGGIPEIISNEKNGFLNEDNTISGLEQTVIKAMEVVKNDDKRDQMMKFARMTAEKFSISKTIFELENLCKKALES